MIERVRSRAKPHGPLPPSPEQYRRQATLLLPQSYVLRQLAARMQRLDEGLAVQDRRQVLAAPPRDGQVLVMDPDEREAKYGRPEALIDFRPGRPNQIVMGGGQFHAEELKEWADELRHYGHDAYEREQIASRPDFNALYQDRIDQDVRRAAGRKTYGAATTH